MLQYPHIMKTTVRVILMTMGVGNFWGVRGAILVGLAFYATSVSKAFENEENEWGDQ